MNIIIEEESSIKESSTVNLLVVASCWRVEVQELEWVLD